MLETKTQIIELINKVISEQVGVEQADIEPDAEFLADLNADYDSLSAVVVEIEHALSEGDIHFTPDDVGGLITVKDLYDLTLEKLNEI